MSRFKRLSHVIWCCKYHVVWVPKYRFRILKGPVAEELYKTIHVYCGRMGCEVIELNIQEDHVHLLVRGVAIFAKACFGHPSPSKRQKLNATAMPSAPRFVLVTTSRPNRGSEHWLQMT